MVINVLNGVLGDDNEDGDDDIDENKTIVNVSSIGSASSL